LQVHGETGAENIIYSFQGDSASTGDGANPAAGLIDVNGVLYGTTAGGGVYGLPGDNNGLGTVFSVTLYGTETVLHRFGAQRDEPDGRYPEAALIDADGTLYGTTQAGGSSGRGTVFSITQSGTEALLHTFRGHDGEHPNAGLINVRGRLYGTTSGGGQYGRGTAFSVTTSGSEKRLHSFGASGDGWGPGAGLVDINGTLYGTTHYQNNSLLFGTVFALTQSGNETVLHSFEGGPKDGTFPAASLIEVNGRLYGTTLLGGAHKCFTRGNGGCGTVFSITPSGAERISHSFGAAGDGVEPAASLISINGTLYGTTAAGGTYDRGTIFSINAHGAETVLHSFGADGDGQNPQANLLDVDGTLYGTTFSGGTYRLGTVFSFSP
jgi:uncharacterized repeat protein (TIGR03803 family)